MYENTEKIAEYITTDSSEESEDTIWANRNVHEKFHTFVIEQRRSQNNIVNTTSTVATFENCFKYESNQDRRFEINPEIIKNLERLLNYEIPNQDPTPYRESYLRRSIVIGHTFTTNSIANDNYRDNGNFNEDGNMNSKTAFGGGGSGTNGNPNRGNRQSFDFTSLGGFGNPVYINPRRDSRDTHENGDRKSHILAKEVQMFIPLFSGGKNESVTFEVNRFIESCQKLLDKASIGEKHELYRLFETRVQGVAYETLSLNGANDFTKMETVLLRAYGPQRRFQEFLNDVQSCTQKSGESTKDYIEKFEKCYRMACSAARAKYHVLAARDSVLNELEQVAKHTFKRGVKNPVLHVHLLNMRKESIEEIIEEAEKFEREERISIREDNNRKSPTPDPSVMVITSDEHEDIKKIKRQLEDTEARSKKMEDMLQHIMSKMDTGPSDNGNDNYRRARPQNNRNNYRNDHQPRYQGNNQRRDGSRRYDDRANDGKARLLECYRCGGPGHFASECDTVGCFECHGHGHNFAECIRKGKEKRGEIPSSSRSGN